MKHFRIHFHLIPRVQEVNAYTKLILEMEILTFPCISTTKTHFSVLTSLLHFVKFSVKNIMINLVNLTYGYNCNIEYKVDQHPRKHEPKNNCNMKIIGFI